MLTLTENTMNAIKEIVDSVYMYGVLSKKEAESILRTRFGLRAAKFYENGQLYLMDKNGQDICLTFPTLSTNSEVVALSM